jgi:hypothetical protein
MESTLPSRRPSQSTPVRHDRAVGSWPIAGTPRRRPLTWATCAHAGFIEPHSHPILAGTFTQAPAHWIALPGLSSYADVQALWRTLEERHRRTGPLFTGLDRMSKGTGTDQHRPDSVLPVTACCSAGQLGHEVYATCGDHAQRWQDGTPADPAVEPGNVTALRTVVPTKPLPNPGGQQGARPSRLKSC